MRTKNGFGCIQTKSKSPSLVFIHYNYTKTPSHKMLSTQINSLFWEYAFQFCCTEGKLSLWIHPLCTSFVNLCLRFSSSISQNILSNFHLFYLKKFIYIVKKLNMQGNHAE